MIDKITGSVILENGSIVLNSKMSLEIFMTTSLYKGGTIDNNYLLKDTQEINGKSFSLTVFFNNGKLKEVHLSEIMNGLSWDNWTENIEMEKKKSHDQWLLSVLGKEPYHYSWGHVASIFDKKGCISLIILRYY
ncbi:hypothetical protein HOO54_07160 [Bacillus sp. WMMC1349]|uniref:hypothetical protein n=1 Tax=Bacillus sp. WMMC1349 TaxID=2736254 RepID=UPI001557727A|nr:hypothetical protein [Bacillus sp. WMMC1349]NPC91997.1 hypothetical protein [Bacillus sp. WMMC1349]